ncbi:YfgG family protein [Yersinia bercovieri]|uniref:YfgG family protein n=1 Tax=Yersinia bercovieri TaxID=634 RepID=UPI0011A24A4D|nr:YfgG family protein [Yersinia bercovieri]
MKRRPSTQLTKIILLVSFLILFGRLLYAAVASISHHQERREAQRVELSVEGEPPVPHESDLSP